MLIGTNDDAEPRAGEKQIYELDAIRQVNAEPVAARETARRELVRHPIRARVDLAERQLAKRAVGASVFQADATRAVTQRWVE